MLCVCVDQEKLKRGIHHKENIARLMALDIATRLQFTIAKYQMSKTCS